MKRALPAITTEDGIVDPETIGDVRSDPALECPIIIAHQIIRLRNDMERGIAHDLEQRGLLDVIGKSGHSRSGLHVSRNLNEQVVFSSSKEIVVPVEVRSLRAVETRRNGIQEELLSVFWDMVKERRRHVSVGRLALADPHNALTKGEIMDAIHKHPRLLLNVRNPEEAIRDDGMLELSLEDLHFLFCERNFDEDAMRSVIRFGKHGMTGLQELKEGRPDILEGRQFFVGAIRLSFGPYVAIIEPETTDPRVFHLAARVLDGVRTSGIDIDRQVELFNRSREEVPLSDIKVRLRLYHATREVQEFSERTMNEQTLRKGVGFSEVVDIHRHPERIQRLLQAVGPTAVDEAAYALLIGPGKYMEVDWLQTKKFQEVNLRKNAAKVNASDQKYCVFGDQIPKPIRDVANVLRYVGREQDEGHVCVSWGFPSSRVMEQLLADGNAVFIAHDLRMREDSHNRKKPWLGDTRRLAEKVNDSDAPGSDVYFSAQLFSAFQNLHEAGAKFILARNPSKNDLGEGGEFPAEVLEWNRRGFWVRPEAREALERVNTVIAMYGSHVEGMEDLLEQQIGEFALRMKKHFGDELAFMHGKGPGVMHIADNVAHNLPTIAARYPEYAGLITKPIVTIGVGIDAEKLNNQSANFNPEGQIDFRAKDRLIRQKHMNDRSTFNIFNIGGLGTLEEIGLSLCSQKLFKNVPAPMIFVDPAGLGKNGTHLWAQLQEIVENLAEQKTIHLRQSQRCMRRVQLLAPYMPKFMHVVRTYTEAADIIESFANDPVKYYQEIGMPQKDILRAFDEAIGTFRETGFTFPGFINFEKIVEDTRWNEKSAATCA